MNIIVKALKADAERRTRMHDLRGNFVGWGSMCALPYWFVNWVSAKLGYYRRLPWIPPPARARLGAICESTWTVVECGAGMSTLWWARRVRTVIAFETNRPWYEKLRQTISREKIENVQLLLVDDYAPALAEKTAIADLIVIDGYQRDKCAQAIVGSIGKPTWVYLDNTDFAALTQEMRDAEACLLSLRGIDSCEYFHGVPPGLLAPTESLLIHTSIDKLQIE